MIHFTVVIAVAAVTTLQLNAGNNELNKFIIPALIFSLLIAAIDLFLPPKKQKFIGVINDPSALKQNKRYYLHVSFLIVALAFLLFLISLIHDF